MMGFGFMVLLEFLDCFRVIRFYGHFGSALAVTAELFLPSTTGSRPISEKLSSQLKQNPLNCAQQVQNGKDFHGAFHTLTPVLSCAKEPRGSRGTRGKRGKGLIEERLNTSSDRGFPVFPVIPVVGLHSESNSRLELR